MTNDERVGEVRFFVVVAMTGVAMGMTAPLTALFAESLGASSFMAGFTVSSIALTLLVVDFFGTQVVQRVGGRFAMTFSLVLFGLGSIFSAIAPSLGWMISARALQGVGAAFFLGGGIIVAVRMAGESGQGRAIGLFNAAFFSGITIGPLLGTIVVTQRDGIGGFRLAFAACSLVCFVAALATRVLLPAMRADAKPRLSLPRPPRPRPGRRALPPLVLSGIGHGVRGGLVFTIIPLLGEQDLGFGIIIVGVALAVLSVGDILVMWVSGALADRFTPRTILTAGFLWGAMVCLAVRLVDGPASFVIWCAASSVVVGVAWVVPVAVVLDVVEDREAGLSTYRIAADVGQLLGGVTAGILIALVGTVDAATAFGVGFAVLAGWVARMPEAATHPQAVAAPSG